MWFFMVLHPEIPFRDLKHGQVPLQDSLHMDGVMLSEPSSHIPTLLLLGNWSQVAHTCNGLEWGLEIGLGHDSGSTRSWSLDQGSVTRALALQLCRKKFPQRWNIMKQIKYLSRGKRVQYVWIETRTDSERATELQPHDGLNHFYRAFRPDFLWPIILISLVHHPYLVNLRIFPGVTSIS